MDIHILTTGGTIEGVDNEKDSVENEAQAG
jgi:L-asparaginase/Glu-tRNA(Gln) amidotransferase subunit D